MSIEEIEQQIKDHTEIINDLETEKERLEDEQEISLKVIFRKQKYWKIGTQDFYCVGDKEYIHVACYQGGGGFDIGQDTPYDLEKEETYSRSGREKSTKQEFENALKSQTDRTTKIIGLD
jgi:hypothetical protein